MRVMGTRESIRINLFQHSGHPRGVLSGDPPEWDDRTVYPFDFNKATVRGFLRARE